MNKEKMLQCDATEALQLLSQVIDNPALERLIGYTEEMKLQEALKVLDKVVTKLKKQEKDLKA